MTSLIPSGIFDDYRIFVDCLLSHGHTSTEITIEYPPTRIVCTSCAGKDMEAGGSSNFYDYGGPMGQAYEECPDCNSSGFKEQVTTDTMRVRVYENSKDWGRFAVSIEIKDGRVMVIGNMSDSIKLRQANHAKFYSNALNYGRWEYQLASEIHPWGFGKKDYFVVFMDRV